MLVTLDVSKLSGWLNTVSHSMQYMFVTLDVSRLSGWLNAAPACRESKEGHAVRGEVRAMRRERVRRRRCKRHARGGPD
eukprot:scaffold17666_cov66-Phaeocystis_antarctica.AAC.5